MAIHDKAKEIAVTICVNRQPLKEYPLNSGGTTSSSDDPAIQNYHSRRTVSSFVECTDDQQFTVKLEVEKSLDMRSPAIAFFLTVDGQEIDDRLLERKNLQRKRRCWRDVFIGPRIGEVESSRHVSVRPMRFGKLVIGKDNSRQWLWN